MAKHISQTNLDNFVRSQSRRATRKSLQSIIQEQRIEPLGRKPDKSIFLSHSHRDKTIILKIGLLLRQVNIDIYIDWMDQTLPQVTDSQTAMKIRKKIEHCNKFLFLATAGALTSKWCNWELGIAYSLKKEADIAVLPIESKSGNWKGSEYLQLFPEMIILESDLERIEENKVMISFNDQKTISLKEWMN